MTTIHGVATPIYYANMFLFAATIGFGTAFIASSVSANFFKWELSNCMTKGEAAGTGRIVVFSIDMEADIGWRDFTVTYLDQGAQDFGCFKTIEQGEKYPIGDYQDNSGNAAAFGMVLSWGVAVVVAMYTLLTMFLAMKGRTTCTSMVALSRLCALFAYGVIIATTVFWWMIEGKFGKRQEALVPRLYELALDAAETCNEGTNDVNPCTESTWHMDTPGWALALGITAMFTYPVASTILWWTAPRIDALNSGDEELDLEMEQANKPVVGGDFVGEKVSETDADRTPGQAVQPEEKARAKDRRSAKTGVRAGGRAPSNTVQGDADVSADPMTYALQQGADEELGSQDDEDEVVYQNHQVHHNVINHSNPNHAHTADDQVGRRQQQYNRGYSRGTSGGDTGEEQSYDERSEADFSETASSAQYYANNQGRSFMSASSQAESFDEYR